MAGRPLRPARDRRLGGPLPRQLANPTQAHPPARGPKVPRFPPKGVCGISPAFAGLSPTRGQIPTRYSPVRHSSAPEGPLPSDLHVLSMPPAFNLSHDQTLQFIARPAALAPRGLFLAGPEKPAPCLRGPRRRAGAHTNRLACLSKNPGGANPRPPVEPTIIQPPAEPSTPRASRAPGPRPAPPPGPRRNPWGAAHYPDTNTACQGAGTGFFMANTCTDGRPRQIYTDPAYPAKPTQQSRGLKTPFNLLTQARDRGGICGADSKHPKFLELPRRASILAYPPAHGKNGFIPSCPDISRHPKPLGIQNPPK